MKARIILGLFAVAFTAVMAHAASEGGVIVKPRGGGQAAPASPAATAPATATQPAAAPAPTGGDDLGMETITAEAQGKTHRKSTTFHVGIGTDFRQIGNKDGRDKVSGYSVEFSGRGSLLDAKRESKEFFQDFGFAGAGRSSLNYSAYEKTLGHSATQEVSGVRAGVFGVVSVNNSSANYGTFIDCELTGGLDHSTQYGILGGVINQSCKALIGRMYPEYSLVLNRSRYEVRESTEYRGGKKDYLAFNFTTEALMNVIDTGNFRVNGGAHIDHQTWREDAVVGNPTTGPFLYTASGNAYGGLVEVEHFTENNGHSHFALSLMGAYGPEQKGKVKAVLAYNW